MTREGEVKDEFAMLKEYEHALLNSFINLVI